MRPQRNEQRLTAIREGRKCRAKTWGGRSCPKSDRRKVKLALRALTNDSN